MGIVKMGAGDNLMATGIARCARQRGKRVAFGDGQKIIWDQHSAAVFRGNPNVARPGSERDHDLEWVKFYRGHRLYNRREGDRWVWNYDFRATPGEMFFSDQEIMFANKQGRGFVLIEPNVPAFKSAAPNKTWPFQRYRKVAQHLQRQGIEVRQFDYPAARRIDGVRSIQTTNFRHALAALRNAALYVGPEGGLHHGAAAVGIQAVVLFGGFIPPAVTGYDGHVNLTGGAEACGSLMQCGHCADAMVAISVEEVEEHCLDILRYRGPDCVAV